MIATLQEILVFVQRHWCHLQVRRATQTSVRFLGGAAVALAIYLGTAPIDLAIRGHMTDGRLTWLCDVPGVSRAMDCYYWLPARYLALSPPLTWALEEMSDSWCQVRAAPETT